MGLNIRLHNINLKNNFKLSYRIGNTSGDINTINSGYSEYIDGATLSGNTVYPSSDVRNYTTSPIIFTNAQFNTQYWFKFLDTVTGLYTIENINTHESKYYECYDKIDFYVTVTGDICDTPLSGDIFNPTITLYDYLNDTGYYGNHSSMTGSTGSVYNIYTGNTSDINGNSTGLIKSGATTNQYNGVLYSFNYSVDYPPTLPMQPLYVFVEHMDGSVWDGNNSNSKRQGGFEVKRVRMENIFDYISPNETQTPSATPTATPIPTPTPTSTTVPPTDTPVVATPTATPVVSTPTPTPTITQENSATPTPTPITPTSTPTNFIGNTLYFASTATNACSGAVSGISVNVTGNTDTFCSSIYFTGNTFAYQSTGSYKLMYNGSYLSINITYGSNVVEVTGGGCTTCPGAPTPTSTAIVPTATPIYNSITMYSGTSQTIACSLSNPVSLLYLNSLQLGTQLLTLTYDQVYGNAGQTGYYLYQGNGNIYEVVDSEGHVDFINTNGCPQATPTATPTSTFNLYLSETDYQTTLDGGDTSYGVGHQFVVTGNTSDFCTSTTFYITELPSLDFGTFYISDGNNWREVYRTGGPSSITALPNGICMAG